MATLPQIVAPTPSRSARTRVSDRPPGPPLGVVFVAGIHFLAVAGFLLLAFLEVAERAERPAGLRGRDGETVTLLLAAAFLAYLWGRALLRGSRGARMAHVLLVTYVIVALVARAILKGFDRVEDAEIVRVLFGVFQVALLYTAAAQAWFARRYRRPRIARAVAARREKVIAMSRARAEPA